MDIDDLSHFPILHNKILEELNLNGLCQYSNLHQVYIYVLENLFLHILYFLANPCVTSLHQTHTSGPN